MKYSYCCNCGKELSEEEAEEGTYCKICRDELTTYLTLHMWY